MILKSFDEGVLDSSTPLSRSLLTFSIPSLSHGSGIIVHKKSRRKRVEFSHGPLVPLQRLVIPPTMVFTKYHRKNTSRSNDLLPLPPHAPKILDPLARVRLRRILVLAHKRIRIRLLVQIAQRVVDLAVLGLVRSDIQQQIAHAALALGHVPVADGNLGGLEVLPLGQLAGVDVGDGERVGEDGLLLEVADEAVAGARGNEVGEEHAVEKDTLGAEDHKAHKGAWGGHFEEGEEVHAFVVGFFEESFDPVEGIPG